MDPWGSKSVDCESNQAAFEDNFEGKLTFEKLADSDQYLSLLERKLKAVKCKTSAVEELKAYRQDCLERLLREGCSLDPVFGNQDKDHLIEESDIEEKQ